ncbi:Fluoroacetate dehalogenase [Cladobotryum mycophilum]|uniref:Fluoroacetate dehalogenase n=1 Tax=Cladobotryum mycophilum TaxID=491253 RepID=A0ABR0T3I6_9HYPO
MFDKLEAFTIQTQEHPSVLIRGIRTSNPEPDSPPLLLLHGFPQTYHIWHRIAPLLPTFNLVIPDLRGYGISSKPAHDVSQYAKSVMARDLIILMDALGFHDDFYICAHDRGARVAHKLLVDYPQRVRKAILLDICPTLSMYELGHPDFAKAYFHWYMLIQPTPLPETLLSGHPRQIAQMFLANKMADSGMNIFDVRVFENYVKGFQDPETVHGWCQEYRASATFDLDEARDDLANGRLIRTPIRVLLGNKGIVAKLFDGLKEWQDVSAPGVEVSVKLVNSGHFIPEEIPEEVVLHIEEFFH